MSDEAFFDGRITLRAGDSRDVLKTIEDCSIDSIVTDPPYALVSIVKRFGAGGAPVKVPEGGSGAYARASAGFMGKQWDTGETAFSVDFWAECLRVLKPGGHIVAFSGTRTYHRMACAIEDAGFEIRDMLSWLYGSGFPKSHSVSKSLRRMCAGPEIVEQWDGWGTAFKPALEPVAFGRKPLNEDTVVANVLRWGTGALNIDSCRIGGESTNRLNRAEMGYHGGNLSAEYSTGSDSGRWPANVLHDGSDDVLKAFPDAPGQQRAVTGEERAHRTVNAYGEFKASRNGAEPRNDEGSAARFFYSAKADADDRLGSKHPTVKPVDLMQWLIRAVTPKGGLVLDPFAGTGTTGEAAFREGMRAILIEREEEYQADIRRRMALCLAGPEERKRESIKAKLGDVPFEAGSLFAGLEAAE